jgi:hypothetical protein
MNSGWCGAAEQEWHSLSSAIDSNVWLAVTDTLATKCCGSTFVACMEPLAFTSALVMHAWGAHQTKPSYRPALLPGIVPGCLLALAQSCTHVLLAAAVCRLFPEPAKTVTVVVVALFLGPSRTVVSELGCLPCTNCISLTAAVWPGLNCYHCAAVLCIVCSAALEA